MNFVIIEELRKERACDTLTSSIKELNAIYPGASKYVKQALCLLKMSTKPIMLDAQQMRELHQKEYEVQNGLCTELG